MTLQLRPARTAKAARLLEIANKCPVHRTLSACIEIASQLVD
jgi:uncharacterized OsmC-like protein